MVKSRPYIILSNAISIDGKISSRTGDSKLSSKKDLIRLHRLRSGVNAIIVGRNTVQRDDPLLTVRYVKGKNPTRIILDSNGTISKNSRILQTCDKVPTIIAISKSISKKNLDKLEKFPIEIIFSGKKSVNLNLLLKKLLKKGIKKILVEGGGTVNWEFIKKEIFDEVIITVSPSFIGSVGSTSLLQGNGFSKISQSPKLRLKSIKRLDNEVVLHYSKL